MPEFRLDHVAVAVRSMEASLRLYRDALGGEPFDGGAETSTWSWRQLRYPGGGVVELLEPVGGRESFVSKFIEGRGEGLHHVTFRTDDIIAAMSRAQSMGYELTDINLDYPGWKEAFFRPSKSHGVLIQIAQSGQ